jgi:agmatine deiminase
MAAHAGLKKILQAKLNRRQWLQLSLAASLSCRYSAAWAAEASTTFTLPAEYAKHQLTWMAHGANERLWPKAFLPDVRKNLVLIAQTIAKYEPVSLLVRPRERDSSKELYAGAVTYLERPIDSVWLRDSFPTLLINPAGGLRAINFHFIGWEDIEQYKRDAKLAQFMAKHQQLELLDADIKLDASALEVDGAGTAILTESSVFYAGRNSQLAKVQIENRLRRLAGIQKVIWLPGDPNGDLARRRTDYYARFIQAGSVLVNHEPNPDYREHAITLQHQTILKAATDAQGQRLKIQVLDKPRTVRSDFVSASFASSYLGFYICNGAVILQEFGDPRTDNAARRVLSAAFPERKIEILNIDALASGGASIHSVTRQQPAL